jgi:sugar phosphate isomerase/epimerase
VLDMLHWQHQPGGPNFDLLGKIPADQIHYVQVCDASPGLSPSAREYLGYAMGARLLPGQGAVDIPALLGSLASMGADPYFALEVFNTNLAQDGAGKMAEVLGKAGAKVFA